MGWQWVSEFPSQISCSNNGLVSLSVRESELNDSLMPFVEFSNVNNGDRSSNASQSNILNKN